MQGGRLGWGFLSTARINERLIHVLRTSERSELVAIASRDSETAQRYAHQWEIPRSYGSYQEMLRDPDIGIIYISSPNHLHAEWSIKCAEAGKHVLCEKPLALSTSEIDEIAAAAQRNGVIVQEAAMMRFHPQTYFIKKLIADGAIGEVRLVRGVFTFPLQRTDDFRRDLRMGGGSLWDVGCYCVSFSRTVLQSEPVEVFAFQTTSDSGVDLSFSAQMRFASGTMVHFFSSFAAFPSVNADLLGTKGEIKLNLPWVNQPGRTAEVHLTTQSAVGETSTFGDIAHDRKTEIQVYENTNAYRDEVESMAASVLDGVEPVVSLADSRNNAAVITALYKSARERKPAKL